MRYARAFGYAITLCLVHTAASALDSPQYNPTQNTPAQKTPAKDTAFSSRPFFFFGTSNYHLRLNESEDKTDRMLNKPFGTLLRNWEDPDTFKDWSDDFRLWDLWIGYGRQFHPKAAWTIYGGGGAGTIPNTKRYYPLFIPMDLDANFTRRSILLGASLRYYPFGAPEYKDRGFAAAMRATRPVLEMNIGYTRQTSIGDVSISLPVGPRLIRIRDEEWLNLFWLSPRAGLEMPLSQNNTLNILGGGLFFHDHTEEFNGFLFECFIKHNF